MGRFSICAAYHTVFEIVQIIYGLLRHNCDWNVRLTVHFLVHVLVGEVLYSWLICWWQHVDALTPCICPRFPVYHKEHESVLKWLLIWTQESTSSVTEAKVEACIPFFNAMHCLVLKCGGMLLL